MKTSYWLIPIVLLSSAMLGLLLYANFQDQPEHKADEDGAEEIPERHAAAYTVYEANCMACHGGEGQGRTGHFPPLSGHVPDMLSRDGGREYLIDVILYGVSGETTIEGVVYDGYMPGSYSLSDEEVAKLINFLAVAWNGSDGESHETDKLSEPEVKNRRGLDLRPEAVGERQPD